MTVSRRRRSFATTPVLGLAIVSMVAVAAGTLLVDDLGAAAPRLKVYFAADFKDAAYQRSAYTKVASAWKRPAQSPKPGNKAVVIVVIQKDGTAPAPTLHLASGSDYWDRAAIAAVTKASPFEPLPKAYTRPSVEVHFHFEYD